MEGCADRVDAAGTQNVPQPQEASIAEQAKYRVIDRPGPGQVRLIGDDGNQIGVVDLTQALELAEEQDLNLVELNPNSDPPTCKLMDYGKFKYNSSKKAGKTKVLKRKEVKMRPKTEQHDFEVKLKNARRFLDAGHKVAHHHLLRRQCVVDLGGRDPVEPGLLGLAPESLLESAPLRNRTDQTAVARITAAQNSIADFEVE